MKIYCLLQLLFLAVTAEESESPNIIVILSDDQGYGDVGAYWKPTESDTPNIDALARRGLRFTDFHSGAARCTPSRAALLTGRLGIRTGVVQNFDVDAKGGLPAEEETVADVLKRGGYSTYMIGRSYALRNVF
ncbi:arylsulfatase G-like [Artemia franciscana]|uniref:arylsulfatase G-like n=1 Tax=Artemia franciscana TaxID=6661 RepID=UPI0032DA03D8